MPPKSVVVPDKLRPYRFHGVGLSQASGPEWVGECPFCGKAKFYVNADTGLWSCRVCGSGSDRGGGNVLTFLRLLHGASDEATTEYADLVRDRGLLHTDTLMMWGVCRSVLSGEWLVPGFDCRGGLVQLYRYAPVPGRPGKRALLATPTLDHGLFGVSAADGGKGQVAVCEGPWDGMALWETLRCVKRTGDGGLAFTGSVEASLAADTNVYATPGANVFKETWAPLLAGKAVTLYPDNDHPGKNPQTGAPIPPAAWSGARRAVNVVAGMTQQPASVHVLTWGPEGYDRGLPHGYDLRDALKGVPGTSRPAALGPLLDRVKPIPDDWLPGRSAATARTGGTDVDLLRCESWPELVQAWRKAMRWIPGLDRTLAVMLAAVASTEAVGDQLWVRVISPPSSGKSVLAEALSVNKQHVHALSTLTGFHSGYDSSGRGEEDNSLLSRIKNKTLIVKDGDTILQAPNRGTILAEARDIYDRTSRVSYRNKVNRAYEGWNLTVILCGTGSLRELDTSELGERFLTTTIVDRMDLTLEREIALRKAYQAAAEMSYVADGKVESRDGPEMVLAKRLTGGYVSYLRANAQRLLDKAAMGVDALERCVDLGEFVACLRARPSAKQSEKVERELMIRLTSQFTRLAKCLTAVLQRPSADADVMARVARVALDTADGRTMTVARHLAAHGVNGLSTGQLRNLTHETEAELTNLLKFLGKIHVVERYVPELSGGRVQGQARYRLTPTFGELWHRVVPAEG